MLGGRGGGGGDTLQVWQVTSDTCNGISGDPETCCLLLAVSHPFSDIYRATPPDPRT